MNVLSYFCTTMLADKAIIEQKNIERIAFILKTLAHPLRLRVIKVLDEFGPLAVVELAERLKTDQSLMSHHLTTMKLKGLLISERDGQKHIYSLKEKSLVGIFDCLIDCGCNYS